MFWRIIGPNSQNVQLQETNDISYIRPDGIESTSGNLQWDGNEAGDKTFALTIKPRTGWEIQKIFHVTIYDIQGFPADLGNGEVSPTAGIYTLTVSIYFTCLLISVHISTTT